MYGLKRELADLFFMIADEEGYEVGQAGSKRVGSTIFRRSGAEIEEGGAIYELIEVRGPNSTIAFDIIDFENIIERYRKVLREQEVYELTGE